MVVDVNPVYYDVPWPHLAAAMEVQLGQLDKAGACLAEAVNQRAVEYQQRAAAIRQRLEIARRKIDQIAKAKQGIVIYSPGSYPVPPEQQKETFKRLFPEGPIVCAKTLDNVYRPLTSGQTKLKEGLHFLDVHQTRHDSDFLRPTPRGMGNVRKRNLRSVADILIFNTTINPYSEEPPVQDKVTDGPEDVDGNTDRNDQDVSNSEHDNSSLTLPTFKDFSNSDGDSIEYQPGAGSTPVLVFPSDLPLEGFITDLPDLLPSSSVDGPRSSSRIQRPSLPLGGGDNILQLPDISDDALIDTPHSTTVPVITSPPVTPSTVPPPPPPMPSTAGLSPPPPPPPPPPPAPLMSSPGGPPPPPPPLPPATPSTSAASPPATSAQPKVAAPTGDRSSLLEAIRNHKGIVGLKGAAKPERSAPKKPVTSTAPPVMDHMEALRERLLKRRQDIAGGGRNAASQPDVTKSSRQEQSEPEKAGLMMGLMDKIVTQKGGDSDSESDQVDEEPW